MTDKAFELRLQEAYDELADGANVAVDSVTLAAVLARGRVRPRVRLAWPVFQRPGSLALVLVTLLLVVALIAAAALGSLLIHRAFSAATDMSVPRDRPVAVALSDGRVVVALGQYLIPTEPVTAEIFDPKSGDYSSFTGDIPSGIGHGLLLPDGRVFVTAVDQQRSGLGWEGVYLLDPESMTARFVQLPATRPPQDPVLIPPFGGEPAIALLNDGKVLIVGDGANSPDTSGTYVFDPITESLTEVGSLAVPRSHPAITTLKSGKVLVAGGRSGGPATVYRSVEGLRDDAELYDPDTAQFSQVGRMPSVRGNARSFLMADERVLIEHEGDNTTRFGDYGAVPVALDVFDPHTNTFSQLEPGNWPGPPTVTQLNHGLLLLTGLDLRSGSLWAAVYDPVADKLTPQVDTSRAIFPQGATTSDGRTVLVGGYHDPPLDPSNPGVPWTDVFQ
jgi:hypothetical protein